MVLSRHGVGEHGVSSTLAWGCVLGALERAPFQSLRISLRCRRARGCVPQGPPVVAARGVGAVHVLCPLCALQAVTLDPTTA